MVFLCNVMVSCEGSFWFHRFSIFHPGFFFDSAFQILRHPGITASSLKAVIPELAALDPITLSRIDIDGQSKFCSKRVFEVMFFL